MRDDLEKHGVQDIAPLGRSQYLDAIRVLAIALVILSHIDINNIYYHNTNNPVTFLVSLLATILCRCNVPLFFMVSGAVLLGKDESIRDLMVRRVLRIILVIMVFSTLQYLFRFVRGRFEDISFKSFLSGLLAGDIQETYWYLYAYIGFLCLLPFLRSAARGLSRGGMIYYVALASVVDIGLPYLTLVAKTPVSHDFLGVVSRAMGVPFYAIAGYYLDRDLGTFNKRISRLAWLVLVISVLIPLVEDLVPFLCTGECQDAQVASWTVFTTMSIFLLMQQRSKKKASTFMKYVAKLGPYAFGMYLIEQFVRSLFLGMHKSLIGYVPGIINSLLYWAVTFIVSMGAAVILKRIPLFRKLL